MHRGRTPSVTASARFRLFGRQTPAVPAAPSPSAPPPYGMPRFPGPPWGSAPAGPPPAGAGAARPGPATRSARPAAARNPAADDPPTDPHGFPSIPAVPVPSGRSGSPDPAEAAALAGAFAVDYLSWDEDEPARRGRVLLDYLRTAGSDPARLGWSGRGRQRAEFALPGLVRPDGEGRVLVDVRVRVTPYRSVGDHGVEGPAEPEPDVAGAPAVAPAPTGRGWRSLASCWIRLSVPVTLDGGRLVVDAWEETLGQEAPPPAPPAATGDEHALADDDPLVEPRPGGAW